MLALPPLSMSWLPSPPSPKRFCSFGDGHCSRGLDRIRRAGRGVPRRSLPKGDFQISAICDRRKRRNLAPLVRVTPNHPPTAEVALFTKVSQVDIYRVLEFLFQHKIYVL